jgi:hypothetical protein
VKPAPGALEVSTPVPLPAPSSATPAPAPAPAPPAQPPVESYSQPVVASGGS